MAGTITLEALVVRDGELHIRQVAAGIADIFDSLLADNDIMIPDDDREGNEDEAPLYGGTYSEFEDGITEQLTDLVDGMRSNGANVEVTKETIYQSFVELLQQFNISVPGDKEVLFQSMQNWIDALGKIVESYPTLPVNGWEY